MTAMRILAHSRFAPVFVLLLGSAFAFADQLRYHVSADLGVNVPAQHLNDRNEVLSGNAFWSKATGFVALTPPDGPGYQFSAANLNDAGQIVGRGSLSNGPGSIRYDAWLWTSPRAAPTLLVHSELAIYPAAINNKGTVVGSVRYGGPAAFPWMWKNGTDQPLQGPRFGGRAAGALDVNDDGAVVGYANDDSELPHAVLWNSGSAEVLGALPGEYYSRAEAISNSGAVAGISESWSRPNSRPGFLGRAFIWKRATGIVDLGTPAGMWSHVTAISNRDWILGIWGQGTEVLQSPINTSRPFLWRPGEGMADLAYLLDLTGTSFESLAQVWDINSSGAILASLVDARGLKHTVILTPVPEPDSWIFAAAACFVFLCSARKKLSVNASGIAGRLIAMFSFRSLGFAVLSLTWMQAEADPLRYEVTSDLGVGVYAIKLNNHDQVLGTWQGLPALWSPGGGFSLLRAPAGVGSNFAAVDLNDAGQIVGSTTTPLNPSNVGLLWRSATDAPLTIPQGITVAINNAGHILLVGPQSDLLWSDGSVQPMPRYFHVQDINDTDAIAGLSAVDGIEVLSNGVFHRIMLGSSLSLHINDSSAVAGTSQGGFYWTMQSGVVYLTPADQASFVVGIDTESRVLGYLDRAAGIPFIWRPGVGITELTSLIDLSGRYSRMQSVADINSSGQILGSLLDTEGRAHIVILTPVPEPAGWFIAAIGLSCCIGRVARQRYRALRG
jgi:probable HAF family extracellular repeat protein